MYREIEMPEPGEKYVMMIIASARMSMSVSDTIRDEGDAFEVVAGQVEISAYKGEVIVKI